MSEEVDYSQYGVKVGTANYTRRTFNNFKVEEGSNQFRILPPLGDLADSGTYAVGHAVHWGYKNSKGKMRTFECIEKRDPKTKMTIQRCPECDRLATFKKNFEDRLKTLTAEVGETKAKTKLKMHADHLRQFNRGFKIYVNALNEKLEIGALAINMTHYKLFRIEADKLAKRGIDVTRLDQGAWFDFFREGSQTFRCDLVRDDSDAIKSAKVGIDVLKRLKNEAQDLTKLFRVLTEEQIQKIVDSDGAPAVIDAIFGGGEVEEGGEVKAEAGADEVEQLAFGGAKAAVEPEAKKATPAAAPAAAPRGVVGVEDEAGEEESEPVSFGGGGAVAKPVQALSNAKASVADMSDDAFRALVAKK